MVRFSFERHLAQLAGQLMSPELEMLTRFDIVLAFDNWSLRFDNE